MLQPRVHYHAKLPMMQDVIARLRKANITRQDHARLACTVMWMMMPSVLHRLKMDPISVENPLGTAQGQRLKGHIAVVPVLRAGLFLLPPFEDLFTDDQLLVWMVGASRNEETLACTILRNDIPNPPPASVQRVIVLDPMLATGGTLVSVCHLLRNVGISQENIYVVSVFAAPPGIVRMHTNHPNIQLHIAQVDSNLNDHGYIVPGCGDFGDKGFRRTPFGE